MKKAKNNFLFLLYTILLGAVVGAIIWAFLKVMNLGIEFLWDYVPSKISFPLYTLIICTVGGLLIAYGKRNSATIPRS